MGEICLSLGAAHSPILFVQPEKWLARLHKGPAHPNEPASYQLTDENVQRAKMQVSECLAAYTEMRRLLEACKPDALLVIGDDQGENFSHQLIPQFIIYAGAEAKGSFSLGSRLPLEEQEDTRTVEVKCDQALANELLQSCLDSNIDIAFSRELPGRHGLGHAHMWPLRHLTPNLHIPLVPVFVNAYFPPTASPERCHAFGQALAEGIKNSGKRVAVLASGGLSHFPRHLSEWGISPYPPEKRWHIDEAFDRDLLDRMTAGRSDELKALSGAVVDAAGNVESRNWLVLAGMLGPRQGRLLTYQPIYTVAIGMGFAVWD